MTITRETDEAEAPAVGHTVAIVSMLVGAVLSPTDYFIVNLALPDIARGLSATGPQLQFVVSAYAVAYAVALIPAGRLGDRFGRRRMFLTGLVAFLATSVMCGLAPSVEVLIAGRFLQGLAAALLSPQVLATFRAVLPERLQTPSIAVYGFMFGLGAVIGEVGGGFLIHADVLGLGWHVIFLVNVPVCVVSFVGAACSVRENSASSTASLDLIGAAVLALGVAALIAPLSLGPSRGWPPWTFACLAATVPLAWGFHRLETRRRGIDPIVDFGLAARPAVWRGLALAGLFYTDSVFFLGLGIYLRDGLHWSSVDAAVAFLPFAAGFVVGPLAVPRLVRLVREWTVPIGFLAMVVGFGLLAAALRLDVVLGPLAVVALAVGGVGHGLVLSSLARVLMTGVERAYAGHVSGMVISSMQIGSAAGAAGLGAVLFGVLGDRSGPGAHAQAFSVALVCLTALLAVGLAGAVSLARTVRRGRLGNSVSPTL